MGSYRITIKASARKELASVGQAKTRQRLAQAIAALAGEPRPPGCEKLAGTEDRYRLRVGDYRILYQVRDVLRIVAVVTVGHRREVYR